MELKTYDSKKGYSVKAGEVIGNIFRKEVTRSKHYFRIVSGYAIQSDIFEKLLKMQIKKIIIKEKDTGSVLTSNIEDWQEHEAKGNWGHGRQFVLSEKYMDIKKEGVRVEPCLGDSVQPTDADIRLSFDNEK